MIMLGLRHGTLTRCEPVARLTFQQRLDRMGKPKIDVHAVSSAHIKKLSTKGLVHPEAVTPKEVQELCAAIASHIEKTKDAEL